MMSWTGYSKDYDSLWRGDEERETPCSFLGYSEIVLFLLISVAEKQDEPVLQDTRAQGQSNYLTALSWIFTASSLFSSA